MKTSVYQYRSASRFLLDRVVERQKADRTFSVRKWAKEMGFPSHSLLAMVLQGKRNLTLKQVPYLAKGLALSTPEKMFFQGLIQIENARTPEEKEWCELFVSELRPKSIENTYIREIDEYITISNWIHPTLLALSDTSESFKDADEACQKIESKMTVNEIRAAIERLVEPDLLKKDALGVYRGTCRRVTTKDDIANRGAREYHKQSAALAEEKIESQDVMEREFQSMAIAVPSNRIPLAKEMIRKFRSQFAQAIGSKNSNQVYQFNLHFFRLTECPSKRSVLKENDGVDSHQSIEKGFHNVYHYLFSNYHLSKKINGCNSSNIKITLTNISEQDLSVEALIQKINERNIIEKHFKIKSWDSLNTISGSSWEICFIAAQNAKIRLDFQGCIDLSTIEEISPTRMKCIRVQ